MIVMIGSEKGGTGKTTLATNLAAMRAREGRDVLLLDTDVQGSATYWCRVRDDAGTEPSIFCTQIFGRLDGEVTKLARKFDDIVIDSGGRDSEELRSGLLVAERVYVPMAPSQFDLWSLTSMATMVRKAGTLNPEMRAKIVINRASTNPSVTETEEAREAMAELEGLGLSDTLIRDRIAFRRATREGLGVVEMRGKDAKAASEITDLHREVFRDGKKR